MAPGRGPGGGGPAAALSREHFLPFVEMAMWSSTPGVKYSAVSGLATLAKVEENKAAMGDVGALECLATIVYDGLELPADDVSSLDINRSPGLGGALAKAQQRLQSDLKLRRLAASTLGDLITHEGNQMEFVSGQDIGGGIPKTIMLLKETKSAGLQQALVGMINTLAGTEAWQTTLVAGGVLPPLLQAAIGAKGEKTRLHAFHACRRLSQHPENQENWGVRNALEVLRWMSLDNLEIKFRMIAMETLRHLATPPANAMAMAAAPGGMAAISRLLDSEAYDDDVRFLALSCISQIAETSETREHLGTQDILQACLANLERPQGRGTNLGLVRMEMHVVERLSECEGNLEKLSTGEWISAMAMNFAYSKDQACRRLAGLTAYRICVRPGNEALALPIIPALCTTLVQSHDSNLQGYCAASLARLSEQEEGKELMRPYFKKLMEVLSIWALDTRKTGKELFNLPQLAAHVASNISNDNPEFKTRVPNVVTLVKSFMALTYSKDKRTQEHSLRLMNNVSDTSEDGKQSLVVMGLVARLKRVKAEGSSASATAKILAKQTLSTHMGLHTAAITIQCICRGFLFRKMKEKAARAQEAAEERRRAAAAEFAEQ